MPAGLGSGEGLPGLQTAAILLCPHMDFSWWDLSLHLLMRPPVLSDQGLTLMTSCNFNYLLKAPSSNIVILKVSASTGILGRYSSVHSSKGDNTAVISHIRELRLKEVVSQSGSIQGGV